MQKSVIVTMTAILAMLLPAIGLADTATDEQIFGELWDTLAGWIDGYLGRIIAGAMILIGIIAGIVRQSLMAFAVGIAAGFGLHFAPTIIENVVGAAQLAI